MRENLAIMEGRMRENKDINKARTEMERDQGLEKGMIRENQDILNGRMREQ